MRYTSGYSDSGNNKNLLSIKVVNLFLLLIFFFFLWCQESMSSYVLTVMSGIWHVWDESAFQINALLKLIQSTNRKKQLSFKIVFFYSLTVQLKCLLYSFFNLKTNVNINGIYFPYNSHWIVTKAFLILMHICHKISWIFYHLIALFSCRISKFVKHTWQSSQ